MKGEDIATYIIIFLIVFLVSLMAIGVWSGMDLVFELLGGKNV